MFLAVFVALLLLLCGCSDGGVPAHDGGVGHCDAFFGDETQAIEIHPALLVPGKKIVPLEDGDEAPLLRPQQGGHCLFVAARVRNICKDDVKLEGKILDSGGALLSGPDGKSPVQWVTVGDYLEPESDNGADMPNVCACPALLEPIANQDVVVEVTASDLVNGLEASARVHVTPTCQQSNPKCKALCECECGPNGAGFCPRPASVACETSP